MFALKDNKSQLVMSRNCGKDNSCAFANGSITPVQQMMSSSVGAMFVATLMTPLDVVKTRLQAQDRLHAKKCFLYSNGIMDHLCPRVNGDPPPTALHTPEEICNCKWYNRPKYFNGTADAIIKISRVEGVRSLWSGLSPTLALALPTTVFYFTSYEQLKHTFTDWYPHPENKTAISTAAGGIARIIACAAVAPVELVRTKMQSQKMAFFEVRKAVAKTVGKEGIFSLWKGFTATMMRDVPFSAIYWPFYEYLRPQEYEFKKTFVAGAVAGTIASTLTLPFDAIKTRRQLELGEVIVKNSKGRSPSNLFVAKEIYEVHGVRGFFTGLTPRIIKVAPACAIMISSYEFCKRFFMKHNQAKQQGYVE